MSSSIITSLPTRKLFKECIINNKGIVVIKFGATWCGPCQRICEEVTKQFQQTSSNVTCYNLDVDECVDLYSFLKSKRQLNGIPAILVYHKDNNSFAPDLIQTGADINEIRNLFHMIHKMSVDI